MYKFLLLKRKATGFSETSVIIYIIRFQSTEDQNVNIQGLKLQLPVLWKTNQF